MVEILIPLVVSSTCVMKKNICPFDGMNLLYALVLNYDLILSVFPLSQMYRMFGVEMLN